MQKSTESEEADNTEEVQIVGELVRPSRNVVVKTTQLPTIYTSELLQQQQQEDRISTPSFEMNDTLNNCFNLTTDLIELQNSNTYLIARLESKKTAKKKLEAQLQTVTTTLQNVQQQKDFQQSVHMEAMKTANNRTTEARKPETIWMDKYNNLNKSYKQLESQLTKEKNCRKNTEVSAQNLKGKFQGKVEEFEKLQQQMNAKCSQYDKASYDLKDANENYKKLQIDRNKLLEKDTNSQLAILKLNNGIEKLKSTISEQCATISCNSAQLVKLSTELIEAKGEVHANASKLAKAENELIEANKEIRQLKDENIDLVDRLDNITSEIHYNYRKANSIMQKFGLGNQENERLPMNGKRGPYNMDGDGGGDGLKKKRLDTIPISKFHDKQTSTIKENQDSIVVPQSQPAAESIVASPSTLNRNSSFSETMEIYQDEDDESEEEY